MIHLGPPWTRIRRLWTTISAKYLSFWVLLETLRLWTINCYSNTSWTDNIFLVFLLDCRRVCDIYVYVWCIYIYNLLWLYIHSKFDKIYEFVCWRYFIYNVSFQENICVIWEQRAVFRNAYMRRPTIAYNAKIQQISWLIFFEQQQIPFTHNYIEECL